MPADRAGPEMPTALKRQDTHAREVIVFSRHANTIP